MIYIRFISRKILAALKTHYISNPKIFFPAFDLSPWNNGKSGAKLDFTSSTKPGLQIHKFDQTRTANLCDWLPCRCAALPLVGCLSATSPSCWGTHFLYLSNPPSGNLLPIIPWHRHSIFIKEIDYVSNLYSLNIKIIKCDLKPSKESLNIWQACNECCVRVNI